jgi:hypothetical protein
MNEDFQRLVAKVLGDPDFCAALVNAPEPTLRGLNIEPTQELLDALSGLDADAVQRLAVVFGKSQAAS